MSRASPIFRSPLYGNPVRNGAYFSPVTLSSKPKVTSIPVHFVGSDDRKKIDPSAAAIKIQKAFRGFLVRKNVRIVRKIEAEVDEVEMKFRREEGMDQIVSDEKERLRINEMLMALLFRLDSVRGVRDYRKRVIRRAIALQEMLDTISAARLNDQTVEIAAEDSMAMAHDEVETLESGDQVLETAESKEELEELKPCAVTEESTLESADQRSTCDQVDLMEMLQDDKPDALIQEAEIPESGDKILNGWELLETKDVNGNMNNLETENQESVVESTVDSEAQETKKEKGAANNKTLESEKKGGMQDVMERLVAENEKLTGLVAELCERSAQQCRLMGGLAQRVEHLEKVVEKMERRKKKRKDCSSSASSVDKKCGRDKQSQ